jgi:transcriptional regulator with XRE-family HTH domain
MRRQGKNAATAETPKQAFAAVLREIRTQRGVSQEALGFESGYHRTFIGLLERAQANPSLETILSISAVLKIPSAELVDRVEKRLAAGGFRAPSLGGASQERGAKKPDLELRRKIAAIRKKLRELELEAEGLKVSA